VDRWLFRTIKLDVVTVDRSAGRRKLGLDQDTLKVSGGLKFIGSENNGTTSRGILTNFSNGGIKARHKDQYLG
jgi:hypothetical protein